MKQKTINHLYLANPKNKAWYAGFVFEGEEEEGAQYMQCGKTQEEAVGAALIEYFEDIGVEIYQGV